MNKRKISLRWQALLAAVLSLVLAVFVFMVSNYFCNELFYRSDAILNKFEQKINNQQLDRLENYIGESELNSDDIDEIDEFLDKQFGSAEVVLVKDGTVIYDSSLYKYDRYPQSGDVTESNAISGIVSPDNYSTFENLGFMKREISFTDGKAVAFISADYQYQLWFLIELGEISLAVIVFAVCFITLINRKIKYIVQLEKEVRMLETGGLDFTITQKGNDELSSLADGLNHMRIALAENIQKEEEATKANYDLVVAVSHDLRTPLTSLILYLDMIKSGKIDSRDVEVGYVEKCHDKVLQIKKMTDQLFDRFYLAKEEKKVNTKAKKVQIVFEESLSNLTSYLEASGFKTETRCQWTDDRLVVNEDYMNRIMDNIASNIVKYADASKSVIIETIKRDRYFVLRFANAVGPADSQTESNKVGVSNTITMMHDMNGNCVVEKDEENYCIELQFKLED